MTHTPLTQDDPFLKSCTFAPFDCDVVDCGTLLALTTIFSGTATLANTEMVTNWAGWCQSMRHVTVLLLSCHEIKNNIC